MYEIKGEALDMERLNDEAAYVEKLVQESEDAYYKDLIERDQWLFEAEAGGYAEYRWRNGFDADPEMDAMNAADVGIEREADIEVRAGGCKEHCARALHGQSECESQWDCADPKVVAQCAEDIARERRAEAGPVAYDSRYSGGIDMTDPNDGPEKYMIGRGIEAINT
jgi:hypothetical protein